MTSDICAGKQGPSVREGAERQGNNCSECKEGCRFGESVYCSIDLRQHPKHDGHSCEWFVPSIRGV